LNGQSVEIPKYPLLLWIDDPTLPLEYFDPQFLDVGRIRFRGAVTGINVIAADRLRSGQGSPGRLHPGDHMVVLGRAAAQTGKVPIKKIQRLFDTLSRYRIPRGYTPRFTVF
jgi:hypothetical protein